MQSASVLPEVERFSIDSALFPAFDRSPETHYVDCLLRYIEQLAVLSIFLKY